MKTFEYAIVYYAEDKEELEKAYHIYEESCIEGEEKMPLSDWKAGRNSNDCYYWFYSTGSTEGIKEKKTKSLLNALNWLGLQGFGNIVDRGHNCMVLTKEISNG